MKELVLGSGNYKKKVLFFPEEGREYQDPVYVDIDPACSPTIVYDLNEVPYPFKDESFDEIHAYEILEHLGRQGDWRFFFDQFGEFHRILKNDGYIFISVPDGAGKTAWVDPGHTRVFAAPVFGFLSQQNYLDQVGKTCIADYRHYWKKDFAIISCELQDNKIYVVLQKKV